MKSEKQVSYKVIKHQVSYKVIVPRLPLLIIDD